MNIPLSMAQRTIARWVTNFNKQKIQGTQPDLDMQYVMGEMANEGGILEDFDTPTDYMLSGDELLEQYAPGITDWFVTTMGKYDETYVPHTGGLSLSESEYTIHLKQNIMYTALYVMHNWYQTLSARMEGGEITPEQYDDLKSHPEDRWFVIKEQGGMYDDEGPLSSSERYSLFEHLKVLQGGETDNRFYPREYLLSHLTDVAKVIKGEFFEDTEYDSGSNLEEKARVSRIWAREFMKAEMVTILATKMEGNNKVQYSKEFRQIISETEAAKRATEKKLKKVTTRLKELETEQNSLIKKNMEIGYEISHLKSAEPTGPAPTPSAAPALPPMTDELFTELLSTLPASVLENILLTGTLNGHELSIQQTKMVSEMLGQKEIDRMEMEKYIQLSEESTMPNIEFERVNVDLGSEPELITLSDEKFNTQYITIDGLTASNLSMITGIPQHLIQASPYQIEYSRLQRIDDLIDHALTFEIQNLSPDAMRYLNKISPFIEENQDVLYPESVLSLEEAQGVGYKAIRMNPKKVMKSGIRAITKDTDLIWNEDGTAVNITGQERYIAFATWDKSLLEENDWQFAEWFDTIYPGDVLRAKIGFLAAQMYKSIGGDILDMGLKKATKELPYVLANAAEYNDLSLSVVKNYFDYIEEVIARSMFGCDWK